MAATTPPKTRRNGTAAAAAAEAAADEAAGKRRSITFGGDGGDSVTLVIPRKWKRFKFMRALNRGDVIAALEAVFGEENVNRLDEIDVTEDEFANALEQIAESLGGVEVGNS